MSHDGPRVDLCANETFRSLLVSEMTRKRAEPQLWTDWFVLLIRPPCAKYHITGPEYHFKSSVETA